MYYEKHRGTVSSDALRKLIIAALLLFSAAIIIGISVQFRRVMSEAASIQAQNVFSASAANAVMDVSANGADFNVITMRIGTDGSVVSVQSDTGRINQLKALLTNALLDRMNNAGKETDIPIGTLTGLDVLAGRGPAITIRMELRGGVNTEITNEFLEAGINQTLHRISCVLSADYYIIMPGCRFTSTLSTTVPLAESVIVGDVPEAFTYVVGDESDTIGRIFDYGAEQ